MRYVHMNVHYVDLTCNKLIYSVTNLFLLAETFFSYFTENDLMNLAHFKFLQPKTKTTLPLKTTQRH